MSVGDILEPVAALLGTAGATLVVGELVSWPVGAGVGLIVSAIFLLYFAQVWAGTYLRGGRDD